MDISIQDSLQGILVWFFAALFSLGLAYRLGYFKLKKTAFDPPINLGDLLLAFIIFISVQMFFTPLLIRAILAIKGINGKNFNELDPYLQAYFPLISQSLLILGFGGYCILLKNKVKKLFERGDLPKDFLVGIITWPLAVPLASFISESIDLALRYFIGEGPVDQTVVDQLKNTLTYPEVFWITSILIITVTPIFEELLFRGFLQSWLKSQVGLKWAIVITSIIFASFHYTSLQSWDNLTILSILFTLSCFLGFVYERQQGLYAPIALHMTFNAVTVGMIFFTQGE